MSGYVKARRARVWTIITAAMLALWVNPDRLQAETKAMDYGEEPRFSAQAVLSAFHELWPGRFSMPQFKDGDWQLSLDSVWYRWAGGKLLTLDFAGDQGLYSPWPFYSYPQELTAVRKLSQEERARLESELTRRDSNPSRRSPALYDQLWDSPNEGRAWDRMKTIRFLGKEVLVNPSIMEELSAIERDLRAAARDDKATAAWIGSIKYVDGYLWRSVAGTISRSFHSYGVALDIMPSNVRGRAWYWLDARKTGLRWFELPMAKRVQVPAQVVRIFEKYGFAWGGKWFFWDAVHFEYRPEILLINGLVSERQESLR
ncbi:MAG: M15 family metallopeptidase [Rectinemataceae bacterium]